MISWPVLIGRFPTQHRLRVLQKNHGLADTGSNRWLVEREFHDNMIQKRVTALWALFVAT
jgi:hypothetical protein